MSDALLGDASGYVGADFSIFTAGMEIDGASSMERPVVRMIGSSTEQDLHSDTMTTTALHDMTTRAPLGLLIWLNHDYTLPGSLFGSLNDAPMIVQKSGIADLHISVEVELTNPEAARTYQYIQRGRRLGCSIGCQVEDYEIVDSGDKKGTPLVHITHVRPVEWSVVGIPANQRSWVENAINGLFERALRNGREDEAVSLAPIVKSLFPRNYRNLVKGIQGNTALKNELMDVPARPTPGSKILWEPETRKFFFVAGENGQVKREIERSQMATFMQNVSLTLMPTTPVAEEIPAQPANGTITFSQNTTTAADVVITVEVRGAEGDEDAQELVKSMLTKAQESEREANKAAQQARAKKYGISPKEGGNITKPSEWADVPDSEWGDPVNYRYPLHDKEHADNAASRWGDESNRSQYSSEEQAIIGRRIAARQRHFGEKSDKSVNIISTEKLEDGSTLYTFSDGSQRIEFEVVTDGEMSLKAVDVAADGTHEPMSGSHTHKHNDGNGEMHNHKHSHEDDASHADHEHEGPAEPVAPRGAGDDDTDDEASKSVEPDVTKSVAVEAEAPTETEVTEVAPEATTETEVTAEVAPESNEIATKAAAKDAGDGPDAQISSLIATADNAIDEVMRLLNIPDVDEKSAGDELATKSGAEISARNKMRLKGAHDVLAAMAGGLHCAAYMAENGDAVGAMRDEDGEKGAEAELEAMVERAIEKAFSKFSEQIGALAASFEGVANSLGDDAHSLRKEFALARKSLEDLRIDTKMFQSQVEDVAGRGLGRPTRNFTGREAPAEPAVGIKSVDNTVAEAQPAKSAEEAFGMTRKEYVAGIGVVRVWPKSAVKEFRPTLTPQEMSSMSTTEILRYMDGLEARVPAFND